MNSYLVEAAAALGLIVNTIAILGVAWKGGRLIGGMDKSIKDFGEDVGRFTTEISSLSETSKLNAENIARAAVQLDGLERRVARMESWHDRNAGT